MRDRNPGCQSSLPGLATGGRKKKASLSKRERLFELLPTPLPCCLPPVLQYSHLLYSMFQITACLCLTTQEELLNNLLYCFVNQFASMRTAHKKGKINSICACYEDKVCSEFRFLLFPGLVLLPFSFRNTA